MNAVKESQGSVKVVGFIPVEMLADMERREVEYKRRKITHRYYKQAKAGAKAASGGLTFKPFEKLGGTV